MATWRNNRRLRSWAAFLLTAAACACAHAQTKVANTCLDCHSVLDPPQQVTEEQFALDIHAQKGLTCASCHGGDPTADDQDAMSKQAGFLGKIQRRQVPALCGQCHSDGIYMRKFNPSLRTDQLSQYLTSIHGKRLAAGDTNVAVCTDCHGVHGIRPAADSRSSVHPTKVPETCSRCHADAKLMKKYEIPTDQFAGYSVSVHHEALTVRGDLSAPTCATCHGNHGAVPPGIASVENVCATCHVVQAQLFDTSPHKEAFAGASLPGCVTCHSNHRVVAPSDAMVGIGEQSLCTTCHVQGDSGYQVGGQIARQLARLDTAVKASDAILAKAESSGMEVSEAHLEQDQARDALTKARVSLHSVQLTRVNQDIEAGLKVASKTHQAGEQALAERDYRRFGLGISLLAILAVVIGLRLTITSIERGTS
jgi:predicted CXXCH cytochrome family protein